MSTYYCPLPSTTRLSTKNHIYPSFRRMVIKGHLQFNFEIFKPESLSGDCTVSAVLMATQQNKWDNPIFK